MAAGDDDETFILYDDGIYAQDPLGAQNYPDVSHGHVKYEDWLKNLMTPVICNK